LRKKDYRQERQDVDHISRANKEAIATKIQLYLGRLGALGGSIFLLNRDISAAC